MEVYVERAPRYISAAKVLLSAVGPAQRLIQSQTLTHFMCNHQAHTILANDGYKELAEIVQNLSGPMDKGVSWADDGFKNMSHFLNPKTLKGLSGWTDAIRESNIYWNKAVRLWHERDFNKSFFFLGAVLHLVQDLCVPHHAMGILLEGHHEFEEWVERRRYNYIAEDKGIYCVGKEPGDWLAENARVASMYFKYVSFGSPEKNYHLAAGELLTRAQRVTAGFIHHFLRLMMNS